MAHNRGRGCQSGDHGRGRGIVAFVLLIALVVAVDSEQTPGGGVGGVLNATSAPAKFAPWLQKAGGLCPQIGAPLLAAQLAQESGFSTQAVSPSGAQGPAQFMPGTWPSWGRDETTYLLCIGVA